MRKFVLKSSLFLIFLVVALEIFVRVLHLYTEDPPRMIDDLLVEKRVPGHTGYAVTGNRRMNFSEFRINANGFNSHRDYKPSSTELEIALVGDSFIEGFHADYTNSLGVKLENFFNNSTEVYEYGYAGYDLANQYHLIEAYKADFDKIDFVVVYLDFATDLHRSSYAPNHGRIDLLASPLFKIRDNVKLLAYISKIGVLDKVQGFVSSVLGRNQAPVNTKEELDNEQVLEYIENFKKLSEDFNIDYTKTFLLLDSRKTSDLFLKYCAKENIPIIDFGAVFEKEQTPTDLVYDQHWNDYGRSVISQLIGEQIKARMSD
nr:hypothetical protein [Allomuricauda sp.]